MHSVDADVVKAPRIVREFVQTIAAPAEEIFLRLCPVHEKAWLDEWDYRMVYSQSGYAEEECVFTTQESETETVWIVTHHDPANHEIHFARFTVGLAATTLKVRVESHGIEPSKVHIRYTHTSLSDAGDAYLAAMTETAFNTRMRFWQDSMAHYLATGQKLTRAAFVQMAEKRCA